LPEISVNQRQHIIQIVLNRPQANNMITRQMTHELTVACQQINQDNDIYVVIITGSGDKAFCAGSEMTSPNPSAVAAIASIDRPVIAAINGDAMGAGLELALACDLRLAASQAQFGLPQVARGNMPVDGATQRLPRIVGKGKAMELILSAATIDAEEALAIGLVNKVVTAAELADEIEALAQTVASKGPVALRYVKEAVTKGLDMSLDQGLRLEADLYFLLHTTTDRTEGITSFREKRPPRFQGQ
jgi:enoyl-CoA hydratase/carnithine racemase